ncbi:sucrose phosphorylase [Alkalispirochaeta americana]|uniref:Sucrose phosphorylase n=1 Tax=Alkalispirochaeta americana TaxID=159291 RepID=A0A1N6WM13_9SPIO|nr:sugar phosphorylase [Alkalispirochaeta americana]SIQ91066.1 sucrose phosphorylase [Alkalispirochaeta americana]
MNIKDNTTVRSLAEALFPGESARFLDSLEEVLDRRASRRSSGSDSSGEVPFSREDIVLITYGDQFLPEPGSIPEKPEASPLEGLLHIAREYFQGIISCIHILPFFPYTSDDGFSVSDYTRVNPDLGSWEPIQELAKTFRLAFDLVLNHTSASHEWFQGFLRGDPRYENFYLHRPADYDTSRVVRPRVHPLLTPFTRPGSNPGEEALHVWTTFSEDQVDLNYANPEVMVRIIDTLLLYVERGASMIRLDAIAYLWKEDGTPCIHHPCTHRAVQLIRALVDHMALNTVLLTETNVPHQENISYFGNGRNEAHLVYNFALPPLTLQAFTAGTAEHLTRWARTLPEPSKQRTFLNFLASHDGIGVTPAADWLTAGEMAELLRTVEARGGLVSWKSTPSGEVPYELNINYASALADPELPRELQIRAFISAHAIMLALAGIPGIYVHSLIGSENWDDGPRVCGHNRAINREKLSLSRLEADLADPSSRRHRVFSALKHLIALRKEEPLFSPEAPQTVLTNLPREVFGLLRSTGDRQILCLTNTSARQVALPARLALSAPVVAPTAGSAAAPKAGLDGPGWQDLISRREIDTTIDSGVGEISLAPFETLWLLRKEMKP